VGDSGTTAAVVRAGARAWAARQGARVEVVAYDPRTGPEGVEGADVWVVAPADLPCWAAAGGLTAVPEEYTQRQNPYAWMSLLPLYRRQLLVWDRTVSGLPLLGESPLCCFRSDLLEDPAHQQAFQAQYGRPLRRPKEFAEVTWEEFADIADYFQRHHPSGRPAPSLPPLPADDEGLDREFYSVAACFARRAVAAAEDPGADHQDEVFSFHYDLQSGAPRIASPGFVHALELLRRLQQYRPPGTSAAPAEAFRDGQAVLCLTDASWLPAFQSNPRLRDKFGICRMPGGGLYFDYRSGQKRRAVANRVPYLGSAGWLAVVPRTARHAEAAFALLADLSGPERSAQVALEPRWGGGPVREEHLNRDRWDAFDLDRERTAALKETLQQTLLHPQMTNPVLCLRIPDQAAHRAALVKELRAALAGQKKPAQALEAAARRWSELDQARGMEDHRAEYRMSLGLLAR